MYLSLFFHAIFSELFEMGRDLRFRRFRQKRNKGINEKEKDALGDTKASSPTTNILLLY